MTMGASKKIVVVEGNGEGGASQKVAVDNAVFVGGDLEAGYIPVVQEDGSVEWQAGGDGSGDVVGPASSVSGNIPVFDGVTGKLLVDSGMSLTSVPPLPAADLTATGLRSSETVGESVAFGDVLYLKSDGKWWKADADAATTMPALRMALATASADAACVMLSIGWARNDAWSWTVGGLIYASVTPGAMSQTAPTGAGDQVQVVGIAYHADKMWFAPSMILGEIA
jgi:hypothetical protein